MDITWTDDLATGVSMIDTQNKEIFRRIHSLLESCNNGSDRGRLRENLNLLEGLVADHFYAEENLQKEHSFPGFSEHKLWHMAYLNNIRDLKKQFKKEGVTTPLTIKANHLMLERLIEHITSYDREMAKFLQEKGFTGHMERVVIRSAA